MLVTLVALLCNSQSICLEKVVTNSEMSGITMASCAMSGQIGLADWLSHSPYAGWRIERYKCVAGPYEPKRGA